MRHTLAAMAWTHERRPRHDMAVGIILVQRLVLRSRPPGAGLLDRPRVPSVDVRTCLERHSRQGHFTSRAGARCINRLLGGPLDAPRTPERGDVTDVKASPEGLPAADAEGLSASWLRA
jgi:hypothetical protein